jgi:hypothetical protein
MIRLSSTEMSLEVVLGAAVAATEPYVTCSYYDIPAIAKVDDFTEPRGVTSLSRTTGATPVTACAAPTVAGTIRNIDYLCIQNADSGAVTVTVRINNGASSHPQYSQSLASGKSLVYQRGAGWMVL